ncbi:helix-turn-helix domain-containing protein, partial [Streptomyces sp. NPDC019539]|uniref:helix-turn-helix domain-containing protein n=1 Tax=Streptomyces sp. NPDC019539 TaxID=3365063 RepID=UPI003792ACDF
MTPLSLDEPAGRYLSFAEREENALLKAQDKGVREIARMIGRDPGTVSRELRRNAATRGGKSRYRAVVAQWKAQQAAKRPKTAKLVATNGFVSPARSSTRRTCGPKRGRTHRPEPRGPGQSGFQ